MNLTIRMPRELHEVIRNLAYRSHVSINQVMIETLLENVAKVPEDLSDSESLLISDDPNIEKLLRDADNQITKQFLKEMGIPDKDDA